MFEIPGFEPAWITGLTALQGAQGSRLRQLGGRRLTRAWLVWDNSDETWFSDGPVVLDFEGERLEICHQKFNELSITWNRIDLSQPIAWEFEGTFPLVWRDDVSPGLVALTGRTLSEVTFLECVARDVAHGMVAVGFRFPTGEFVVTNGLDENLIEYEPPDSQYRVVPVQ